MVAGYMAFVGIFAIFPFLIFVTALLGFLGTEEDMERIMALLFETLPGDIAEGLEPVVAEVVIGQPTGFLTFGILATLWAASNGIEAISLAFNRAYRVEELRPFWLRRLQNAAFVIVMALTVPLLSLLIVLAPLVIRALSTWFFLELGLPLLFTLARYGVAILALFVALLAMHRWLPNRRATVAELLPGVALTIVLFMVAGTAFSLYLEGFADYSVTYGSMASIVIALMFLYMTSVVVVLGGYVNAELQRQNGRKS